jgi:ribosomal protein S18 acetylase RimI-like enzyme
MQFLIVRSKTVYERIYVEASNEEEALDIASLDQGELINSFLFSQDMEKVFDLDQITSGLNTRQKEDALRILKEGVKDPELYDTELQDPVWIKNDRGDIVGYHMPFYRDIKTGWRVGNIYVDPQFRGYGWARKAVEAFVKEKSKVAPVMVRVGNTASERLFSACGFKPSDYVKEGYRAWSL